MNVALELIGLLVVAWLVVLGMREVAKWLQSKTPAVEPPDESHGNAAVGTEESKHE